MDCYICNSALDHFSICETCYKKADVELERVRKLYAKEMEDCNAAHKRAGSHWKKLEAEIQAHNITKKELLTAEAELSEARAKSSRLEARCGDLQDERDQLKAAIQKFSDGLKHYDGDTIKGLDQLRAALREVTK